MRGVFGPHSCLEAKFLNLSRHLSPTRWSDRPNQFLDFVRWNTPSAPTPRPRLRFIPRAPMAIWVGIPRAIGSREGWRDFFNFLNDIRVKTVGRKRWEGNSYSAKRNAPRMAANRSAVPPLSAFLWPRGLFRSAVDAGSTPPSYINAEMKMICKHRSGSFVPTISHTLSPSALHGPYPA